MTLYTALIGSTGFIGGNLASQARFDHSYHATDIDTIRGREYELIACAGAPGTKWLANQHPEADQQSIGRLMHALETVTAKRVVLISTVDVYPSPVGVDEDSPIDAEQNDPYGRHRRLLEEFIASRFPTTIVRLPALFGPGLKKNVIYDFLHKNRLDLINPTSILQFYDLSALWQDIGTVLDSRISLVNFATEPVSVEEVAREAFGFSFRNGSPPAPVHYDFRSLYAAVLGGRGGYLRDRATVLQGMRRFVAQERTDANRDIEHRLASGG